MVYILGFVRVYLLGLTPARLPPFSPHLRTCYCTRHHRHRTPRHRTPRFFFVGNNDGAAAAGDECASLVHRTSSIAVTAMAYKLARTQTVSH